MNKMSFHLIGDPATGAQEGPLRRRPGASHRADQKTSNEDEPPVRSLGNAAK